MARREGTCCICGVYGPLSFEHVPPKSAFNNQKVIMAGLDEALKMHPLDEIRGRQQQRGFGEHTLCESCNNKTGDWYAKEYTRWAVQAHILLEVADAEPLGTYIYHGVPLRFIKQAVTIMFSAVGEGLARNHPELVKFVLDRRKRHIENDVRLYAYYNPGTRMRIHSFSAQVNIRTHRMEAFAEFAAYPFGFVLVDEGPPPDDRLVDITWMSQFGYDDCRSISLRLPSFPVVSPLPGSYFTTTQARGMRKPE